MSGAFEVELSGDISGSYTVTRERPLTMGRAGAVKIVDTMSSRMHCQIEIGPRSRLLVRDLDSLNGTHINGIEIQRARLSDGDTLQVGEAVMRVRIREFDSGSRRIPRSELESRIREQIFDEGFDEFELVSSSPSTFIFYARRVTLDQPVTLKVLDTKRIPKPTIDRFVREARIAAKLNHPNIITLYDARRTGALLYMVLEHCYGRTLLQEANVCGPLPARRAVALTLPIARALAYAHGEGVIHRDICPSNALVTVQGLVKLIDFGLAKSLIDAGGPTLTMPMQSLGSTLYAAPEQLVEGRSATEHSDQFAFGATLYHLLAGQGPFADANNPFDRDPPKPLQARIPGLPSSLIKIVERCMEKEPAARFWGFKELVLSLESAIRELFELRDPHANLDLLIRLAPGQDAAGETAAQPRGATGLPPEAEPLFVGNFSKTELIEFIQMLELNCKSGLLKIRSKDGFPGEIHLRNGAARSAQYMKLKDEEAIVQLLSLPEGSFRFLAADTAKLSGSRDIRIQPLLLEIMRRRDQANR